MVTYSGSLVQSCGGEGRTLQANITGLGGSARSVSATLACPRSWPVCFPVYTAQAPGCSAGGLSKAGPGSHALPRSKLLRFRFSGTPQRRRLSWACVLCLPRQSSSGSQELDEHTLPRCSVPYPLCSPSLSFWVCWSGVPCVSSGKLISGCDPSSVYRPSRISGSLWLETGSLFAVWQGMPSLGPICPFPFPAASCLW